LLRLGAPILAQMEVAEKSKADRKLKIGRLWRPRLLDGHDSRLHAARNCLVVLANRDLNDYLFNFDIHARFDVRSDFHTLSFSI